MNILSHLPTYGILIDNDIVVLILSLIHNDQPERAGKDRLSSRDDVDVGYECRVVKRRHSCS